MAAPLFQGEGVKSNFTAVVPGVPIHDVEEIVVSAKTPLAYFTVPIPEPSLVSLFFNESTTASRCAVFLSCTCPQPNAQNAAWRLISPETVKRIVLHPADTSYIAGTLYCAVQYLEESGQAAMAVSASVQVSFQAMWMRPSIRRVAVAASPAASSRLAVDSQLSSPGLLAAGSVGGDEDGPAFLFSAAASFAPAVPLPEAYLGSCCSSSCPPPLFSLFNSSTVYRSLYVGSWHGAQREGVGIHYYAAVATAASMAPPPSSSVEEATGDLEVVRGIAALLHAFTERYNIPWSAWSIADTLAEKELQELGYDGAPRNELSSTGPALPDELESILQAVQRNMKSDIHTEDVTQWRVLPLQPGVEIYAGEWAANRKSGRGSYQWADRSYVGSWVDGRREGFGLLRRSNGSWYRGEWKDNRPSGHGAALLLPSKTIYTGEWERGLRSGDGVLTYPDGMTVTGKWKSDVLQPRVSVVYVDGATYEGEWTRDRQEGVGIFTDPQMRRYTNHWSAGKRSGEGSVTFPNGVIFQGTWADDVAVEGKYHFPNGDVYTGDFDENTFAREGTGECVTAKGYVYTGSWHADQKSGNGTMRYTTTVANSFAISDLNSKGKTSEAGGAADGGSTDSNQLSSGGNAQSAVECIYEGEWLNDLRNGHGCLTDAEGIYEGCFLNDRRCGEGEQRNLRTGSFYRGCWKDNHRTGRGTYYSATKQTTYEGIFLQDRLAGVGTAESALARERYEGTWLDGLQQGYGTLVLPNGDTLRGTWHRGVPEEPSKVEYAAAHDGSRYVGLWSDNQRNGTGMQIFAGGSVYEGDWSYNVKCGRGRLTYVNGESVECSWKDDKIVPGCEGIATFIDGSVYRGQLNGDGIPHGYGNLTYPDGTVFTGSFVDGVYQL